MSTLRFIVIVSAAVAPAANQAAHTLGIDPDGKLNTFSVPLVPSSGAANVTPTNYGAMGRMPDSAFAAIKANTGNRLPASWYALDDNPSSPTYGTCLQSFDGSQIGSVLTFDTCLSILSLQRQNLGLPSPS